MNKEKRHGKGAVFPKIEERGAEITEDFRIQEGECFMPATGSKKSSAARRRTSGGKQGRKTSGRSKTSAKKRQTRKKMDSGIWREVLVLTVLAVSILLFISNFGIGGIIGNAVSRFFSEYSAGWPIYSRLFCFSERLSPPPTGEIRWQYGK